MRIKSNASFPHPVLAESTGDYGVRKFELELAVREELQSGSAQLSGTMALDDPEIGDLLESGNAKAGLMILCQETYLDRFEECRPGQVQIDLSGGVVRGPVFVRGVVIAACDKLSLTSDFIVSEFPPESRIVRRGDVIALTEELRFEAGLEKLAPLESIFHLKRHDEVPEGVFRLDLESEAIEILVAPSLHGFLSLLRGQPMRDVLLSSLFLPVVMSVLEAMRGEGAYAERRWYGVMNARCSAAGVDFRSGDLLEIAQRLLEAPLGAFQTAFERASE